MSDSNQQALIAWRLEQARTVLDVAKVLQHAGKTTLGTVNRAYYAMFYTVLALLQKAEELLAKADIFVQKITETLQTP